MKGIVWVCCKRGNASGSLAMEVQIELKDEGSLPWVVGLLLHIAQEVSPFLRGNVPYGLGNVHACQCAKGRRVEGI